MNFFEFNKLNKTKEKQKNRNFSVISIISIIIALAVLVSQLAWYGASPFSIQQINAQNPDRIESVKKEQPVNKNNLIASYDTLIANNYPYPIYYVEKFNPGPAIIYNGIVMSKNSKPEDLNFNKWGIQQKLNLYNISGPNKNISLFNIDGNTYGTPSGFMSKSLKFTDRYISLNFGSIYKYPETAQITVQLEVVGDNNRYDLYFVNGRLGYEGWLENRYYKQITSNSSELVDLVELITTKRDSFSYLERININVEKNTAIGSFPFRIDFGKSTINTPGHLDDGALYFVNGYVFQNKVLSNDFRYLLHDWQFKQVLSQEFIVNPSYHNQIAINGWDIEEVTTSRDNLTNNLHLKILSEKIMPLRDPPLLDVLSHLDVYNSLLQFGTPKDILFVVTMVLLIALAFHKRKSIPVAN